MVANVFVALSPSDFAYLLQKCPRCWWLKTRKAGEFSEALPSMFKKVDSLMREQISVDVIQSLGVEALAPRKFGKLRSEPIEFPSLGVTIQIFGYLDQAFEVEGGLSIEEFKMTEGTPNMVARFTRQVHSYVFAIENPQEGEGEQVLQAGLTCWSPEGFRFRMDKMEERGSSKALMAYQVGSFIRQDVPIDRGWFMKELERVAEIAAGDLPPSEHTCDRCRLVDAVRMYVSERERKRVKRSA